MTQEKRQKMRSIDKLHKKLNFSPAMQHINPDTNGFEERTQAYAEEYKAIAANIFFLLEKHQIPKNCRSVVSIGCGLCQELLALIAYLNPGFLYVGIDMVVGRADSSSDIYEKCTEDFKTEPRFFEGDVNLFFQRPQYASKFKNKFDLVFLRHPYLYKSDIPGRKQQCDDVLTMIVETIPQFGIKNGMYLFASFYTELEHLRFERLRQNTTSLMPLPQTEMTRKNDNQKLAYKDHSIEDEITPELYTYTAMLFHTKVEPGEFDVKHFGAAIPPNYQPSVVLLIHAKMQHNTLRSFYSTISVALKKIKNIFESYLVNKQLLFHE